MKKYFRKIKQNRVLLATLFIVSFIPVIYAGTFLASIWDPYSKIENLKISVVNEDEPVIFNGQNIELGNKISNNLKQSRTLNWQFTDLKTAEKDLTDGDTFMIVHIPKDFSKNSVSFLGENPQKVNISFKTNVSKSKSGEVISTNAAQKLSEQVRAQISENYSKILLSQLSNVQNGFSKAASGSEQISNGISSLGNGLNSANSGAIKLKNGAEKLNSANQKMAEASNKLAFSATEISNKTNLLSQNSENLQKGLQDFSAKSEEFSNGLTTLNSAISDNSDAKNQSEHLLELNQKVAKMHILAEQTNDQNIKNLADELAISAKNITADAQKNAKKSQNLQTQFSQKIVPAAQSLAQNSRKIQNSHNLILAGEKQLSTGVATFSTKMNEFNTNEQKIPESTAQLLGGINTLNSGIHTLNSGTTKLQDGSNLLTSQLSSGAEKLSKINFSDESAKNIATPVKSEISNNSGDTTYGKAMAPYFIALGLFVGAISFNIAFPIQNKPKKNRSAFKWWLSRVGIMAGFAGAETLVLTIIFSGIFNISPADINSFVLNSYVSAFSFLLIVHALMFAFGRVGQFASIVFMILQLASSGGMFPIATTPQIFQNMAPFMPLYYSLTAFRQAILGGLSQPIFESSIFSLIIFGLIFGAISLLAYCIKINSSENKTLSSNKI